MRFIDEAKVLLKAGDGGNGCRSFRREAHEPHGGPNGGDGGKGGDIIIETDPRLITLADYHYRRKFSGKNGEHGKGKECTGRSGEDLIIKVPVGTLIKDEDLNVIVDLSTPLQSHILARGGRGGRGNQHFATSTNRAPRRADPGEKGEEKIVHLELKLLADVGLIGRPNAGKSTLLSKISQARPKIADYPFTTLVPQLGFVRPFEDHPGFTVADIPGLIEGAHLGHGLGIEFLRHIERTKIFLHMIDLSNSIDPPENAYQEIHKELISYQPAFKDKPEWIVLNKIDALTDKESIDQAVSFFSHQKKKVFLISAVTGEGIQELIQGLVDYFS